MDNNNQQHVFNLINLQDWPNMPSPWSSIDRGEAWVWGDFFLIFQTKPQSVHERYMEMHGMEPIHSGMLNHYSMTVYYRQDRNPHGPSSRPIMVIALEQADYGMVAKLLGGEQGAQMQNALAGQMGPMMFGLYFPDNRLNLGEYQGGTDPQVIRQRFLEILGHYLGVSGQPHMIGEMLQAYGHPETGLRPLPKMPPQASTSASTSYEKPRKSPWLWVLIIVVVLVLLWVFFSGGD